jgi:hypothetical protein
MSPEPEWLPVDEREPDREQFCEFAVYNTTTKRIAGFGRWASYRTEADARDYLAWLEENREELRVKAEANEASGFEGGNGDWWVYNKDPGWKDAEWVVVERAITAWRPIEEPT